MIEYKNENCTGCFVDNKNITNKTYDGEKVLQITQAVNTFFCTFIVIIGIIGNFLTCCVFNYKSNNSNRKYNSNLTTRRTNRLSSKSSIKSSKAYILALAFSDLLFLFAHTIEDILPNLAHVFKIDSKILNIIDHNEVLCKIILYLRNATRVSSSYLVVLFALERLMICSHPLKRLRFHYKNFNRNITIIIFLVSHLLTSYTPIVSGLRKAEKYEEDDYILKDSTNCDTKKEYLGAYFPITLSYVIVQIILPSIAICYLNFSIIKVLMTRKHCVVRSQFKTAKSATISSHDSAPFDYSSFSEVKLNNSVKTTDAHFNSNITSISPSDSLVKLASLNLVQNNFGSDKEDFTVKCVRKKALQSKSQSADFSKAFNQICVEQTSSEQCPKFYKSNAHATTNSDIYHNFNNVESKTNKLHIQELPITNSEYIKLNQKKYSLVSHNVNESNSFRVHPHTQNNSCWILRHSRLFFKLKKASRATSILILISFFYVILNLPYAISWLCFFILAHQNWYDHDTQKKVFGLVYILEIFHISNYCINFFLYCFSSKVIREELKLMLLVMFRSLTCRQGICFRLKSFIFKTNSNDDGIKVTTKRLQKNSKLTTYYDESYHSGTRRTSSSGQKGNIINYRNGK